MVAEPDARHEVSLVGEEMQQVHQVPTNEVVDALVLHLDHFDQD